MFVIRGQADVTSFEKAWKEKVLVRIVSDYEEVSSILVGRCCVVGDCFSRLILTGLSLSHIEIQNSCSSVSFVSVFILCKNKWKDIGEYSFNLWFRNDLYWRRFREWWRTNSICFLSAAILRIYVIPSLLTRGLSRL